MAQEKKEIIDLLKPGAEVGQLEAMDRETVAWLKEEVNVFDMWAELFKNEGVDYMFGIFGGWESTAHLAALKAGIQQVNVRHEMTAAFAAEGMGRLGRRPGAVLIGGSTGADYATAGLTQALSAQSPLIMMTGQDTLATDNMVHGQGITRGHIQWKNVTKYATRVCSPSIVLWEAKRAFRSCMTPPTGPVAMEYPGEFLNASWWWKPRWEFLYCYEPTTWGRRTERPATPANSQDLERAMKFLMEAERPAIVAGEGVIYDDAVAELREFTQLTGIPTHSRRSARGAVSEYDPLNCCGRARGAVMRRCDRSLVLGLRCQYLEMFGYPPFWNDRARYIQAQTCPENVCMTLPTEVELEGNVKIMLRQMIDWCKGNGMTKPPQKWNDWRAFVLERKENYWQRAVERAVKGKGKVPLHPDILGMNIGEFLHDELNDDYYVVQDAFTGATYFADWQRASFAPSVLDSSDTIGFGHFAGQCLAWGLATNRDKPIIATVGDGALGSAMGDIETLSRWNIPAVLVHWNNNYLVTGPRYMWTKREYPAQSVLRDHTATLPNIRYDRMMKEYGCHTEFVERDVEIKPALKRAFDFVRKEYRPAFIEAFIDPDVLQEIWGTWLIPMFAGSSPWDEVTEQTKKMMAETLPHTSPEALGYAHPTWAQGMKKYRKEHGME